MTDDKIAIYTNEETNSELGIYIPKELYKTGGITIGYVVSAGPGRIMYDGRNKAPVPKPGDRVVFNTNAAAKLNVLLRPEGVDSSEEDTDKYDTVSIWVCKEVEVICILKENENIQDPYTNKPFKYIDEEVAKLIERLNNEKC